MGLLEARPEGCARFDGGADGLPQGRAARARFAGFGGVSAAGPRNRRSLPCARRPIVAGDVLTGVLHVDRIREAGGHGMVSTRVELADDEGRPVTTVTSTIVVRGEG